MTSHQLAKQLLKHEDQAVTVSVDISTGDDDFGKRAFGIVTSIQEEEKPHGITILAEGEINEPPWD